jgi:hypothetical protein
MRTPFIEFEVSNNNMQGQRGSGFSANSTLPKGKCSYVSTMSTPAKQLSARTNYIVNQCDSRETELAFNALSWPNSSQIYLTHYRIETGRAVIRHNTVRAAGTISSAYQK